MRSIERERGAFWNVMVRLVQDHILLIGDARRELEPAIALAAPDARVTRADTLFDAIADAPAAGYSTVVANTEPIERRPEAAVKMLRELAGEGRVVLFGHPTLEPVARKMLEFGCDDYIVTPPNSSELQHIFRTPLLRIVSGKESARSAPRGELSTELTGDGPQTVLQRISLAEVMLDAFTAHPGAATTAAIKTINQQIAPALELSYRALSKDTNGNGNGATGHGAAIMVGTETIGHLQLKTRQGGSEVSEEETTAFLSSAGAALSKLATLQDRHSRLYKLAITDQLTGVYNRRHFEMFLASILERAKTMRFQVTLLLFDIDNFKKYNDECGHAMGDEILKETATLMRRCCREHDLVARIGGDEFAVVFWEKELPRQPKDGNPAVAPGRVPQEPLQILQRFRNTISSREFSGLGASGKGILTISGGLASFPWDGRTVEELVDAADRALIFGAKKGGKNSIYLVGGEPQKWEE
jgi:GGDEF domain-containing protein